MKKMLSMMLIMASFVCFTACSEDDEIFNKQDTITKIEIANGNLLNNRIGDTNTLKIIYEPSHIEEPKCFWHSSDWSVVSIDRYSGKYHALTAGECIITATVKIQTGSTTQELTAECKIIVSKNEVECIEFDISEKEIEIGENFTLTTMFTPKNATNKKLEWSSSDSSVASVDNQGTVSAISEGECYIYAKTQNDKIAKCKVTVLPASIEHVDLSVAEIKLMSNESLKVDFTVYPSYANVTDIKWNIEDETIATVTKDGVVTCHKIGRTKLILIINEEFKAECDIICCDIDGFVEIKFGGGTITSIGGYITANIGFELINNSSYNIKAKNVQIIDGYSEQVLSTLDLDNCIISGKSKESNSIRFNNVYKPIFRFNYIYNDNEYYTEKQFEVH